MNPTITEQQAHDKVEQYINDALAVLPSTARRELFSQNRSECTDPTDNGPRGRYEISATYRIIGLDAAHYPEHFNAVVQWWTGHDFAVLADKRPKDQYVFARNKIDSFDMSVQSNDLGELYLGATSPCVWPRGTPDPVAEGSSVRMDLAGTDQITAAAREPAPTVKPRPRPRRPRVDEEVEDFDQTDWTDEG